MLKHQDATAAFVESLTLCSLERLIKVCGNSDAAFILVSSETGLSPVPLYPLGRQFQDLLGLVNQKMADAAGRVYLVVSGIPIEIKIEIKGPNPENEIP